MITTTKIRVIIMTIHKRPQFKTIAPKPGTRNFAKKRKKIITLKPKNKRGKKKQ